MNASKARRWEHAASKAAELGVPDLLDGWTFVAYAATGETLYAQSGIGSLAWRYYRIRTPGGTLEQGTMLTPGGYYTPQPPSAGRWHWMRPS